MNKYQLLKDVIKDYIYHAERANEKRADLLEQETKVSELEMRAFRVLVNNLKKITEGDDMEVDNVLSQN